MLPRLNFGRLVKSMNFRLTSGQTSDEKILEKNSIGSKNRRQISGGLLGGVVLMFERQKRTKVHFTKFHPLFLDQY